MKTVVKFSIISFFIALSHVTLSGSSYFWLLKIKPNLRTFVNSFGRVYPDVHSTAKTGSPLTIDLFHLNQKNLATQKGIGPNPQRDTNWDIKKLESLNWQELPQTRIIAYANRPTSISHKPIEYSPTSQDQLFSQDQLLFEFCNRNLFNRSPFYLNGPLAYLNIPWNNIANAARIHNSSAYKYIEITPSKDSSPLIDTLKSIPFQEYHQENNSKLVNAIQKSELIHVSDTSYNPLIFKFLSGINSSNSIKQQNNFYSTKLKSYSSYSDGDGSLVTLVPHETMINLNLIPKADIENDAHINPDNWGNGEK